MTETITLRELDQSSSDLQALRGLAERDSRGIPQGRLIGAELSGRLLAAIAVDSGELIADPFSGTVELRSLLELRRAQVRRHMARQRWPRRRRLAPREPARAALAGSPPGAGGRLLDLS
ncbi:MAG: hypothetical protein ACJ75R_11480 [Solirubrobacterales bacterium]